MCGIAAASVTPGTSVDLTALARLLVAGLAERGEDACGYAWREPDGSVVTARRALPPERFLAEVHERVHPAATQLLVHVRDHTKGHPSHDGNNHPLRHGRITAVHNGIIQNDDELFAAAERPRATHGATVDSEALLLQLDLHPGDARAAFPALIGSYAAAWLDDARPDSIGVVRGVGRPLHRAQAPGVAIVASTPHALRFAASHLPLELGPIREVPPRTMLELCGGTVAGRTRIDVAEFDEGPTVRYHPSRAHARRARDVVRGWLEEVREA